VAVVGQDAEIEGLDDFPSLNVLFAEWRALDFERAHFCPAVIRETGCRLFARTDEYRVPSSRGSETDTLTANAAATRRNQVKRVGDHALVFRALGVIENQRNPAKNAAHSLNPDVGDVPGLECRSGLALIRTAPDGRCGALRAGFALRSSRTQVKDEIRTIQNAEHWRHE
jgi:hypothetical protein